MIATEETIWNKLEYNRFAVMTMVLLVQSCVGSVGVFYIQKLDALALVSGVPLAIMAVVNIVANAVTIAQVSIKLVVYSFMATVITSIVMVILHYAMV